MDEWGVCIEHETGALVMGIGIGVLGGRFLDTYCFAVLHAYLIYFLRFNNIHLRCISLWSLLCKGFGDMLLTCKFVGMWWVHSRVNKVSGEFRGWVCTGVG